MRRCAEGGDHRIETRRPGCGPRDVEDPSRLGEHLEGVGDRPGKQGHSSLLATPLDVSGPEDNRPTEDHEEFVLVVVTVEGWSETAWGDELDHAELSFGSSGHLHRGQVVEEMVVLSLAGIEYEWALSAGK